MGAITANFKQTEFTCRHCDYNNIDERLVHRLQVIRDYIRQPIVINSGCRCAEHNKNVGGAPDSYHLRGMAADFWVQGSDKLPDSRAMAKIANEFRDWSGGFHYYEDRHFIHVDIGPKRRW